MVVLAVDADARSRTLQSELYEVVDMTMAMGADHSTLSWEAAFAAAAVDDMQAAREHALTAGEPPSLFTRQQLAGLLLHGT